MAFAVDVRTTRRSSEEHRYSVPVETVGCLQCGGSNFEPLLTARDPLGATDDDFRLVRCRRCDLAITNPRPTSESISKFYPHDYSCHDVGANWDMRLRARLRRSVEQAVLRYGYNYPPQPVLPNTVAAAVLGRMWIRTPLRRSTWIPFAGDGARMLDFGCGAGGFLRRMQELGWKVEGLDISADVASEVARQLGVPVHVGTLPHNDLQDSSYDVVTMWQALEHVPDPRGVIRAAAKLLRRGGWLYASVPNLDSWSFSRFRHHWFGLELPRHLTHFTPTTLRQMVESEGLKVHRVEQLGMDGWIRQSARRATAADWGTLRLQACRWKPLAMRMARWTERAARADNIMVVAQRT